MPTCDPATIFPVIKTVMEINRRQRIASILDVGCGMGKWGMLFREYLEGWWLHHYKREMWKIRLDGVDVFEDYFQPWHRALYDHLFAFDLRERPFPPEMIGPYDLVYLGDTIEHLKKDEGHRLLRDLKFRTCIISTPTKLLPHRQGRPNPFLEHLSLWTVEDFKPYAGLKVLAKDRKLIVRFGL